MKHSWVTEHCIKAVGGNKFKAVAIVTRRVKDLMGGAKVVLGGRETSSLDKQNFYTIAMQEVASGRLSLDDLLSRYLRDVHRNDGSSFGISEYDHVSEISSDSADDMAEEHDEENSESQNLAYVAQYEVGEDVINVRDAFLPEFDGDVDIADDEKVDIDDKI